MTNNLAVRFVLIALAVGVFSATLAAQQVEVFPNAGGFWPRHTTFDDSVRADMRDEGIYSLKWGAFLTPHAELEGSVGYVNHFESRIAPTAFDSSLGVPHLTVYGILYDINGVWNFGRHRAFGTRVSPFVVLGVGGLSTSVRHGTSTTVAGEHFTTDLETGAIIPSSGRLVESRDGDAFLTLNYGVGFKAMNLWGPVGLRADIRGRTIPNFYGEAMHWPEFTGGLDFTWGQR